MKKITLELSEQDFLNLLKVGTIGSIFLSEVDEESETENYKLMSLLYSKTVGLKNAEKYIQKDAENNYELTDAYADEISELFADYNYMTFWETLETILSERDLFDNVDIPENEIEKFLEKNQNQLKKIREKYAKEFDKNGIKNLRLVKESTPKAK